jgi:FimV-like protein
MSARSRASRRAPAGAAPVLVLTAFLTALLAALAVGAPAARAQAAAAPSDSVLAAVDGLRQEGRFQEALDRLTALEAPDSPAVRWRLALTRVDVGEQMDDEDRRRSIYETALADAEAAVRLDSTEARAHLAVAVAQGRLALDAGTRERVRRSRAVKEHAERAIDLDPTLDAAYHVRARWHRKVSDLGFFERTIVRTVYGGLPDASIEQAVADLKRSIEIQADVVDRLELARTYRQMGREEDARRQLKEALAMQSRDPDDPRHKKEAREMLDELQ